MTLPDSDRRRCTSGCTTLYGHLRGRPARPPAEGPWNRTALCARHGTTRRPRTGPRGEPMKANTSHLREPSRRGRSRRYPGAYNGRAVVRPAHPTGRPIRLVVGPAPTRAVRAIWLAVRQLFGVPDVPPPRQVPNEPPRCLHCKGRMTEKYREPPEPYGAWAMFTCHAANCPVCQGPCRSQSRMFLPAHWESGRPGEITCL